MNAGALICPTCAYFTPSSTKGTRRRERSRPSTYLLVHCELPRVSAFSSPSRLFYMILICFRTLSWSIATSGYFRVAFIVRIIFIRSWYRW